MVCLHGTDSAVSTWRPGARVRDPSIAAVDEALYERRTLVRLLAMRRTVFVVPTEDAPIVQAAAAAGVARVERRRTESLVASWASRPEAWLREAEAATWPSWSVEARRLPRARPAGPMLAARARLNPGQRIEGEVSMASRMLLTLAVEGRVVRGRPRGTWLSNQYRWTTMARWLGAPLEPRCR